jgi:hypothetical protein
MGNLVGAQNSITLCDLRVLVEDATEAVTGGRSGCVGLARRWGSGRSDAAWPEGAVRTMLVEVPLAFGQHRHRIIAPWDAVDEPVGEGRFAALTAWTRGRWTSGWPARRRLPIGPPGGWQPS